MRWLIVEDALRDRKGHWFEYLSTFNRGLRALGDDVTILADRHAEPFILDSLQAKPILSDSIWHRMGDGAGALRRYLRVPVHAGQTWLTLRRFLRADAEWDIIFVPTVLVHHLMGWYGLIRYALRSSRTRVLLFFPNLPIRLTADGSPAWTPGPTTRLMRRLFDLLKPDILSGRVILGVETQEMRAALAGLLALPVIYFPHPVEPLAEESTPASDSVLMACYGPGRQEKGSDVLQDALVRYLDRFPEGAARFAFQWTEDFRNSAGEIIGVNPALASHPRVTVIRRYFDEGEYAEHLLHTQVMLLPYRRSSYALRVSRVMIEAMVNGIPTVATAGTSLTSQAGEFGAVVKCEDGSAESLAAAIATLDADYPAWRARALRQMPHAREHFSVGTFRQLLLDNKKPGFKVIACKASVNLKLK